MGHYFPDTRYLKWGKKRRDTTFWIRWWRQTFFQHLGEIWGLPLFYIYDYIYIFYADYISSFDHAIFLLWALLKKYDTFIKYFNFVWNGNHGCVGIFLPSRGWSFPWWTSLESVKRAYTCFFILLTVCFFLRGGCPPSFKNSCKFISNKIPQKKLI